MHRDAFTHKHFYRQKLLHISPDNLEIDRNFISIFGDRTSFHSKGLRRDPWNRNFFPWCFPIWEPDVKVAKNHSSSKRKKEPKASFSMGFRSYVRLFRGAILGLLRPSEAWCFAAGRWFFPWCFPIWGPDVKVAKIHGSNKRKKEPKASFSMGCRSYVFWASPSFRGMVFCCREVIFSMVFSHLGTGCKGGQKS